MSIRALFKLIGSFAVAILVAGLTTGLAMASDWNQNNIIDENLFTATASMSQADIQTFLNNQGGFLASWTDSVDMYSQFTYHNNPSSPTSATTTITCKVHTHTGMSAAQIIYQAATNWNPEYFANKATQTWKDSNGVAHTEYKSCGTDTTDPQPSPVITTVSPKVILTTLQKEQSLITATGSYSSNPSDYTNATYPSNQYALAWAMGYGVPDSGGKNGVYRGFYMQVMYAAWQLRLDNQCAIGDTSSWPGFEGYSLCGGKYTVGEARTIDGTTVTPQNGATDALYNYTPHFSGNQHFVTLYEQWFGPVHGGPQIGISELTTSTTSATVGQPITVSFTLTNNESFSMTLPEILVATRLNGQNYDFGPQTNVTIASGQTYTLNATFTPSATGNFTLSPAFEFSNVWYQGDSTNINVVMPSLSLTQALSTNPEFPLVGNAYTASYQLKNTGTRAAYLKLVGISARDPRGANVDFPYQTTTIQPGATYAFSAQRTPTDTSTQTLSVSYMLGNNAWYSLGSSLSLRAYTQAANLKVTQSLAISPKYPVINHPTIASFTVHNYGDQPVRYKYLGMILRRTSDNANFDFNGDPSGKTTLIGGNQDYTYQVPGSLPTKDTYHGVIESSSDNVTWTPVPAQTGITPTIDFQTYSSPADVSITGSTTLSENSVQQNQIYTYSYTLKNTGDQPVDYAYVGTYCRVSGRNCDNLTPSVTLGGGQQYTYSSQQWQDQPGSHTLQPMVNENGNWILMGSSSTLSVASFVPSASQLTYGLSFDHTTPAIGSTENATMTITNHLAFDYHIPFTLISARLGTTNLDFDASRSTSINSGQSQSLNASFLFKKGGTYSFTPSILIGGSWHSTTPTQKQTAGAPSLGLTQALGFSNSGRTYTATFSIKNNELTPITLTLTASDRQNVANDDYLLVPVTVQPGQTYAYSQSQTFAAAGNHTATVAYMLTDGSWHVLGTNLSYSVQ